MKPLFIYSIVLASCSVLTGTGCDTNTGEQGDAPEQSKTEMSAVYQSLVSEHGHGNVIAIEVSHIKEELQIPFMNRLANRSHPTKLYLGHTQGEDLVLVAAPAADIDDFILRSGLTKPESIDRSARIIYVKYVVGFD